MTREEFNIQLAYRNVFLATQDGRNVLTHMLTVLHYFDTLDPDNPEEIALHNYAKVLLKTLGIFEAEDTRTFMDSLIGYGRNMGQFLLRLAQISTKVVEMASPDQRGR